MKRLFHFENNLADLAEIISERFGCNTIANVGVIDEHREHQVSALGGGHVARQGLAGH